jgi:hypothetical protein
VIKAIISGIVQGLFSGVMSLLKMFLPSTDRQLGRAETTAADEKKVIENVQKADAAAADPAAIKRVRDEYSEP